MKRRSTRTKPSARGGRARQRWATALLVLVSTLGTVVLADVALLLIYGPVRTLENFYEPDPRFGYRMRPNAEFLFASPYHGYSAMVRTNAQGLRDDPVRVPKPRGVFRVLLLGDSMTAGLEVQKDETFEARCEKQLRAHGDVEVINAGVRGYNLDNVLSFFEHEGASYAPDLVVYMFVQNDLRSVVESQPNQLDPSRGFTLRGVAGWLAGYSHLTYRILYLRQMLQLRKQRDANPDEVRSVRVPDSLYELLRNPNYDSGVAYHQSALRVARLAEMCARIGAEFLLLGAPHRVEVEPEAQAWWNRYLARPEAPLNFDGVRNYLDWVAVRHGVRRLDPIPEFRRRRQDGQSYWFHKDDHLNALGHEVLAHELTRYIEAMPRFRAWRGGGVAEGPGTNSMRTR